MLTYPAGWAPLRDNFLSVAATTSRDALYTTADCGLFCSYASSWGAVETTLAAPGLDLLTISNFGTGYS